MALVTQDSPSSSQCETTSRSPISDKERARRAVGSTRPNASASSFTEKTTPAWELHQIQSGTGSGSANRFIINLRGHVEPGGHHKCEMRILNRMLTWRAVQTGRAKMINCEGDQRQADLLLMEYGIQHGDELPWCKNHILAEEPAASCLPSGRSSRSTRCPVSEKLVHCFGSTRRPVRQQRDQQNDGTTTSQCSPHHGRTKGLAWC